MAKPIDRELRLAAAGTAAACALPMALHVPTTLALVLAATLTMGALSRGSWPLWLRAILMLVMSGLVLTQFQFRLGRDSASGLLLAMLALKTFEVSSARDLRSLVGFSLFAPFAAFLQDQGPLTLLLALPAVVAVLLSCARLAEADAQDGAAITPLRIRLRSVGAALAMALPLALAGFWLFPRLQSPLWGMPDNAIARTGLNDQMAPGDYLDLMTDDSPAFRVRFLTAAPAPEDMYWRGPVLTRFDGRSWTRSDWWSTLPAAPVEEMGAPLQYEITLEPTERRYLFALDLPQSVSVDANMGLDRTLIARTPLRNVFRYEATSTPARRFEPELKQTFRQAALSLPPTFNPRTLALAQSWRAEGATDRQVIQRALEWINSEFTYTLETPLLGRDSVDEFLFDSQRGFCEHFSSSFTILMRSAGIPARVVTGYSGGYRNPLGDFWLVRNSDAHAWAEVWLPGRGWVRIDPTAAVAPERILDASGQSGGGDALAAIQQVVDLGDWALGAWSDFVLQFNSGRQRSLLRPFGIDDATGVQLGIAFALGAGVALALTLWLLLREVRPDSDPLLRAWRAFGKRLAARGLAKAANEPAISYGRRLADALPEQAEVVLALSRRFAEWRYAGLLVETGARAELARDLRRFRLQASRRSQGVSP